MANWNEIMNEIKQQQSLGSSLDIVRRKYIEKLYKLTERNVICYYSGFLSNSNHPDVAINDKDMTGFMTAINKLDKSKGLDLIMHTPGGEVTATEAIGNYLREVFGNDIRVIVPQLAMSGGTMLSCIGKEIIMGKHSNIGPVDPQIGGTPCYGIIQEFEKARKDIIENPKTIPIWQLILTKYPPAFIEQCYKAIELANELIREWLENGAMFDGDNKKAEKIENIIEYLNNNKETKIHSRHISAKKAKEIGLKVMDLEDNDALQDAVLSIHHCYMHTFSSSKAVKIIENHLGMATISIQN